MLRRARLAFDLAVYAGALVLVMYAVTYTALRLALPGLAAQGPRIEAMASRALGHELRYGSLEARMVGLTPRLRLRDVTLTGEDGVTRRLERLDLAVALVRSAWARELRLADVRASGLRLDARRDPDGRWWLGGIALDGQSDSNLGDWLLAWPRAHLHDAVLEVDDQAAGRRLVVGVRTLDLRRDGNRHTIRGFVDLDGALRGRAAIVARAEGLEGVLDDVRWRLAARLDAVQADDLTVRGVHLATPLLIGTVHLRGTGLALTRVTGNLGADARLSTVNADAGLRHARLRGVWQRRGSGWVLGLDRAGVGARDARATVRDLLVEHSPGTDQPWRARVGSVQLPDDAALWALVADWHPLARTASGLAPAVAVRDIALATGPDGPRAGARLETLRWAARGDRIGIAGVAGPLRADAHGATLDLRSEALELNLPKLYRQVLRVESPRARAVLRRDEGVWELAVPDATATVRALPVAAALRLRLGTTRTLGLSLAGADLPVAQVAALLPDASIQPQVLDWYGKAVGAGRVRAPRLLLYGPLGRFFRDGVDARFLLHADFEGVDLDYRPGADWPPLRDVDGTFAIDGRELRASGTDAMLWDSAVDSVSATLADFKAADKVLAVRASARGDAAQLLRLARETPLRERVGGDLSGLAVAGPTHTTLDLDIHFEKPLRFEARAQAQVRAGRVVAPGAVVEAVSGTLHLVDGVIQADGLEGAFLGGQARFGVRGGGADGVRVSGAGSAPAAELAARIGVPAGVDGAARWQGTLDLAPGQTVVAASVDLEDAAVAVPAPLGKARGTPGTLDFELRRAAPDRWNLAAGLPQGGRLLAELARDEGTLRVARADLALGQPPALPDTGVRVRANLAHLDADPWIAWASALAGAADRPPLDLTGVDIHADVLTVAGRALADQTVRLTPGPSWQLVFDGPHLAGTATLDPVPGGALGFDLGRLHWPDPPAQAGSPERAEAGVSLDPARFPVPSGRVADLRYGERALGTLELRSARGAAGLVFEQVRLTAPSGEVSGAGAWEKAATGTASHVNGTLKARNLGELARAMGLGSGIERGNGEVVFDAAWPGGPQAFALAGVSGQARIRIADASLPDIEPGLGRLLGVLSLETLQRRLLLDFRDLFGRGFAVDDIRGTVHLASGTARTTNLRVRGPAAHLTLSGDVHLPSRSLDLEVSVVPQLTSSLPAAVAIGSLGVGAAILIGQRLLGDTINEMSAQTYRVLGTLDTPQVSRAPAP